MINDAAFPDGKAAQKSFVREVRLCCTSLSYSCVSPPVSSRARRYRRETLTSSCSRESVSNAMRSIGKEELENMIREGKEISVGCQFCDENYVFTVSELEELLP